MLAYRTRKTQLEAWAPHGAGIYCAAIRVALPGYSDEQLTKRSIIVVVKKDG